MRREIEGESYVFTKKRKDLQRTGIKLEKLVEPSSFTSVSKYFQKTTP